MSPTSLTQQLHELAVGLGAARTGVCTADTFIETAAALRDRIGAGLHGGLRFTYADPATASDVQRSFPWAERLFVAAWAYLPEAGTSGPPDPATTRVARFATADHYEPLRRVLGAVADELTSAGFQVAVLVDDNRLVDRAAAVRAGVGWWGKNTMVLAPGLGPWILLGSVATDAPLDVSDPMVRDCGTCDACLPACPTGALVAPGVLDARRCLAALLQQPGAIPMEFRVAVGDRLYGCDDCLDACPPGGRLLERSTRRVGRHSVRRLLALDDEALLERFAHFYVPKRRAALLRRNLLVVLGNVGDRRDVAVLGEYLVHRSEVLRAHAAWALGRIGGPEAADTLEQAAAVERLGSVRREIELARSAARSAAT